MRNTAPTGSQTYTTQDNKHGDVLQTSTTVASLAVALAILLPSISKLVIIKIGDTEIPLMRPLLLLCGLLSLMASIWTIDSIRREANIPVSSLFLLKSSLGLLFLALCLFLLVYLGVVASL